jgi:hypothetical protein
MAMMDEKEGWKDSKKVPGIDGCCASEDHETKHGTARQVQDAFRQLQEFWKTMSTPEA